MGIFWLRGARDSVQDPQGPSFCESGGGGGKQLKSIGRKWETVIVLVKCLGIVYLEPVNLTLTLGM